MPTTSATLQPPTADDIGVHRRRRRRRLPDDIEDKEVCAARGPSFLAEGSDTMCGTTGMAEVRDDGEDDGDDDVELEDCNAMLQLMLE